jgi:hypothetical protein
MGIYWGKTLIDNGNVLGFYGCSSGLLVVSSIDNQQKVYNYSTEWYIVYCGLTYSWMAANRAA